MTLDLKAAADRWADIQRQTQKLNEARARLDKLARMQKKKPIATICFNDDDSRRNDYFTHQARVPMAVLVQQAIYDCMTIERNIIALGGQVEPDVLAIKRRLDGLAAGR